MTLTQSVQPWQRFLHTLLLMTLTFVIAQTGAALPVDASATQTALGRHFDYWIEDATALQDARFPRLQDSTWKRHDQDTVSFGYSPHAYWFRARLVNAETHPIKRIVAIDYPPFDHIRLMLVNDNRIVSEYVTGDTLSFPQRPLFNANFRFPLELQPGQVYELYLRVHTEGSLKLPAVLWEKTALKVHDHRILMLDGIFFGALLLMALFNLFVWFSVREVSYLYYVLFVTSFAATFASLKGYAYQYFWPLQSDFNEKAVLLFLCSSIVLGLAFSRRFLQLPRYNPRLARVLLLVMGAAVLAALMTLLVPYHLAIKTCAILTVATGIICIVAGVANYRTGNRSARFYVLAWSMLLLGVMCYPLTVMGVLPAHPAFEYFPQIGELLEVLLLSFALADRINSERIEKMRLQQRVIEEERKAYQEREAHLKTQIEAQREELEAQQQLENTRAESTAKSQFLATMSHEIRTPMNGILGIAELMQDTPLSDTQRQQLDVLQNSGKALLSIINDILDYSKIEAGKMDIELIDCDPAWLLEETRHTFAEAAQRKDLTFAIRVLDPLPQRVRTDPTRLRQILGNLLRNALKFTSAGAITLSVRCIGTDDPTQCRLHFAVADTGVGILPEQRRFLFQPFSQVDASSARKFGGTGMGLTISQRLVELMGGEIGVESEPGKGSLFWFELPCAIVAVPVADTRPTNATDPTPAAPRQTSLEGLQVLIAEDNPVNTMVVKGLLKKLGMTADAVVNGALAVEARQAEPERYVAILMDCEMPVMDGYEATRVIRQWETEQQQSSIPIIALTAHAMQEHCERADAVGMSGHVAKPIELEMLRNELVAQISRHPTNPH